jgi:hypothetical protein
LYFICVSLDANPAAANHRLFVAPVESDVQRKDTTKSSPSQSRSSIRRSRRSDDREARAIRRRYAAIRDTLATPAYDDYRFPWIESGHPPPSLSYTPPEASANEAPRASDNNRPLREALREMASRVRMADNERLISLLGDRPSQSSDRRSNSRSNNTTISPTPDDDDETDGFESRFHLRVGEEPDSTSSESRMRRPHIVRTLPVYLDTFFRPLVSLSTIYGCNILDFLFYFLKLTNLNFLVSRCCRKI